MNPTPAVPAARSLPLARLLNHAADAVQAVRAGRSLDDALAATPEAARAGTQAIAFLALRRLGAAETLRAALVPRAPAAKADALLLVALALLWPDDAPPYAPHTVVDQAVAAMRQRAQGSAGLANAVLRRYLREREALVAAALDQPLARWNHRPWWIARLQHDWPVQWQDLLAAANRRPPMTLRVHARHGSTEVYLARLTEAGLGGRIVGPQAIVLDAPCPVQALPGFAAGDVSVQDAAAQRAAPLLLGEGLPQGARVLDACAAPGGKTAHLLELADLDVLALDSDASRLKRVDDTLARLGLRARTLAADAGTPAAWWDGRPFDAILLDAPCSAAGIVRRHPDIRWLRRESDIPALAAQQDRLLDALWPLLAPGGRLLFCTCSVFRAEGQERIDAFLQRHPEATRPARPHAPGHLLPLPDNGAEAGDPDGFFYELLAKP